jgi:N utilization substance protein B
MVKEAISLTHNAINRLGTVIDFPEIVQLSSQYEVREYALELIGTVYRRRAEIEQAEMLYLDIPQKVAINEAIELAKRYSDDEGYRFINGVLRRVTNKLNEAEKAVSTQG